VKPVTIESVMAVYEAEKAALRAALSAAERERDEARALHEMEYANRQAAERRVGELAEALRAMLSSVSSLDLVLNYPEGLQSVKRARAALAPGEGSESWDILAQREND
jgi:hypothetical protein